MGDIYWIRASLMHQEPRWHLAITDFFGVVSFPEMPFCSMEPISVWMRREEVRVIGPLVRPSEYHLGLSSISKLAQKMDVSLDDIHDRLYVKLHQIICELGTVELLRNKMMYQAAGIQYLPQALVEIQEEWEEEKKDADVVK